MERGGNDSIDKCVNELVDVLHKAARNIPEAKFCARLRPYLCPELDTLKRNKMFWFKKGVGQEHR